MNIINSTPEDTEAIFKLYDEAVAYQKLKFNKHWQAFDADMVKNEILESRQWKIIDSDNNILCIFATTYNDPFIWEEKDRDPSIYLHRIVTNPLFRGKNYVMDIIDWAKKFGRQNSKKFIRIDTWGDNEKLIVYYTKCGFNFLGITTPSKTADLPKHYSAISLSLFEIEI
ncbi:MAG: GNAT family N-acetyltransferase [Ferruginibacter sp.]